MAAQRRYYTWFFKYFAVHILSSNLAYQGVNFNNVSSRGHIAFGDPSLIPYIAIGDPIISFRLTNVNTGSRLRIVSLFHVTVISNQVSPFQGPGYARR